MTLTCLVKSREPEKQMIWSCCAQRNALQLQTIGCSRCWTFWKVGQNSGLSISTPGRPLILSSAFQQRNRRPTYISAVRLLAEVTFNKQLTWKQQSEKAEARTKLQLALIKKLAGTTWGTDTMALSRLYTGRVRLVLKYSMTAWGTKPKFNFDWVNKVQNQAACIITEALKSMPIAELQTVTGLQSLEDCRDYKLLNQAVKFKRLQDHSMRQWLSQPTKGRMKRGREGGRSFIHQIKNTLTTWGHARSWPQTDLLVPCCSCLEWGNFHPHSLYHPQCWSEWLWKHSKAKSLTHEYL